MAFITQLSFDVLGPLKRKVTKELIYYDKQGRRWVVPINFITDGASIPWWAWSFVGGPFSGLYLLPAVLHDFFCQMHDTPVAPISRKEGDVLFLEAMDDEGVGRFKRWYMFNAVKVTTMVKAVQRFLKR